MKAQRHRGADVPRSPASRTVWRLPVQFRLQHLALAVTVCALAFAALAALRGRVAREQAALHEAQMMGASFSRFESKSRITRWLDALAAGPTQPLESLSFQNMDSPYESIGPYGPGGRAVTLHQWTPKHIDRLSLALHDTPFLTHLSFWHTTLPDHALPKLVHPSLRLVHLNLEDSGVGDDDVVAVLPGVPNLQRLVLSRTGVSDAAMGDIGRLDGLTLLHLERTAITDQGLKKLAGLALEELDLGATRVSTASLRTLADMRVAKLLILPAEWPAQDIRRLAEQLPASCDCRQSASRLEPSS
jgi:hypothetical protein